MRELGTCIFSLLAAERHAYFRTFILCSVAGIFGLFPLIFTPGGTGHHPTQYSLLSLGDDISESIVKVLYSIAWLIVVYIPLRRQVYE